MSECLVNIRKRVKGGGGASPARTKRRKRRVYKISEKFGLIGWGCGFDFWGMG